MEDKKTELQKRFEEQTPTIKDVSQIEYLQTFISWLHLQVERFQGEKLPIQRVINCPLCGGEMAFIHPENCTTDDCPNCVF